MLSNDELKQIMLKAHPEYLDLDKKGGYKWKTARVFSVVLYPENIENISESCTSVGVPCSLSPLHNADLKDADSGELKKEHYHHNNNKKYIRTMKYNYSNIDYVLSANFDSGSERL